MFRTSILEPYFNLLFHQPSNEREKNGQSIEDTAGGKNKRKKWRKTILISNIDIKRLNHSYGINKKNHTHTTERVKCEVLENKIMSKQLINCKHFERNDCMLNK